MIPLLEENREKIAEICRNHHVRRLSVFGSAVRDDFDPERSDVDFLVEFSHEGRRGLRNYFSFSDSLSALLARPVGLVSEGTIRNEYLQQSIDEDRRLIYAA
jgi:uncharacterized protein